jgi:hypothetical protein
MLPSHLIQLTSTSMHLPTRPRPIHGIARGSQEYITFFVWRLLIIIFLFNFFLFCFYIGVWVNGDCSTSGPSPHSGTSGFLPWHADMTRARSLGTKHGVAIMGALSWRHRTDHIWPMRLAELSKASHATGTLAGKFWRQFPCYQAHTSMHT